MIPTPHINAKSKDEVAETILLPGDPLRAKFIAETYLDDVTTFNTVRNAFGYTGTYNGKRISVLGTGMGMPSMGIYSYELIHFYGVKNLIRIGSAGSFQEHIKIRDIVFGISSSTDSNFASQFGLPGTISPTCSYELLEKATTIAKEKNIDFKAGNILSSDIFYGENKDAWKQWQKMGVMCVEMESAALYLNAQRAGVNALCILTISDSLVTGEATTSEERQLTFTKMMEIALSLA